MLETETVYDFELPGGFWRQETNKQYTQQTRSMAEMKRILRQPSEIGARKLDGQRKSRRSIQR